MHEIDLIPAAYKRQKNAKKMLVRFAGVYALLFLTLLVGKAYLSYKTTILNKEIAQLQEQQQAFSTRKQTYSQLQEQSSAVKKQLAFVELIQQGGGADKLFQVFDRVLEGQVWMESWSYTAADLAAEESAQAGQMKINIKGHALDHLAMSKFIERLIAQPEINNVEVKNSSMVNALANTVAFEMEVL